MRSSSAKRRGSASAGARCLAPATGELAPLVVLADGERTREPVAAAPFTVRRLSLHPPATTAAALRRRRGRASRAPRTRRRPSTMGSSTFASRRCATPSARSASIRRAAAAAARAGDPDSAAAGEAARAACAARIGDRRRRADESARACRGSAGTDVAAASSAKTEPGKKRSAKGAMYFGGDGSDDARASYERPEPPSRAEPPPAAPVSPPAAADPAAFAGDGAPLPVARDATPDELARIATISPSAAQRVELINRLRTVRSAAVVAMLRANAASPHPAVRAAAEAAMGALFGPNWNATRAIPKPVQPPPSDDKDRGPPGGW